MSNVKHEDTGDYKCEIMTNEGVAHQWHAIEIQGKISTNKYQLQIYIYKSTVVIK